jgi:toxin ParE1/3/4
VRAGRAHVTVRADADIRAIAIRISRDNVQAGVKWADELHERLNSLADTPGIGTDRGNLRPGLRSTPFGKYLIFFRPIHDGVRVIRVIHGAQRYERYFK